MTDKIILFGDFEFPMTNKLEYLFNEEKKVTDYLFVNEPRDEFSIYFEKDFPVFKVPQNSKRPYCLFEINRADRVIKFFCPERLVNLDTVVWYFYVELFDENGGSHILPGQVRIGCKERSFPINKDKLKFINILEEIKLNKIAVTA